MYSVFKHSQVTYNHTEPYFVAKEPKCGEAMEEKCTSSEETLPKKQVIDEEEALKKYEEIIASAKCEAEKMIEKAKSESQNLLNQNKKEGFEKGMVLAAEKLDLEMEKLEKQQIKLQNDFENKVLELKKSVLSLSFVLSEKIIKKECQEDDQVIIRILDEIIRQYRDEKHLTIEVSKNNSEKLSKILSSDQYDIRSNENFQDSDIQVSSDNGVVDASVNVQFANLKNALLKESISYGA